MLIKKLKASILGSTLVIMGIVLVTALSISAVSVRNKKASLNSSKSNQAYQVADSGIEAVMDKILNNRLAGKTASDVWGASCNGGKISDVTAGYAVDLKIYDGNGDEKQATCSDRLDKIVAIKSVGTAGQSQRAIEAAVAAVVNYKLSCENVGTGYDIVSGNTYSGNESCVNKGDCIHVFGSNNMLSCSGYSNQASVATCCKIVAN